MRLNDVMRFFVGVCLCFNGALYSQSSQNSKLDLVVLNQKDSLPVPFASVYTADGQIGTYTNEQGKSSIDLKSNHNYKFQISSLGFVTKNISFKTINSEFPLQKVYLQEDQQSLSTVEIYGETQKTTVDQSGFSTATIDLKNQESRSIQLNQIIDNLPGVSIRQEGGLGSRVQYNINGLSGNAVKIFIDGTPLEYFGESYSLASIPTNSIERIEVYKGVVPAELGGDILGGAIQIITKQNNDETLDLSYQVGSFNTHQLSVIGGLTKEEGLMANGQIFYNYSDNDYEVWGEDVFILDGITPIPIRAKRFHDAYENFGTKLDLGWNKVKWADQFSASILYSNTEKEVQHGATMIKPYGERFYTESNLSPSLKYEKLDFLANGLNIKTFLSYSDINRHLVDTTRNRYDWTGKKITHPGADQGLQFSRGEAGAARDSYTSEGAWVSRINTGYVINRRNSVNFNLLLTDFKRKSYNREALIGEDTRNDRSEMTKIISGISFSNTSFEDRLKTNLFLKQYFYNTSSIEYDIAGGEYFATEHDTRDINYGFGTALNYDLSRTLMLQFSAERTVRLPSSNELFGNASQNVNTAYALKPEISENLNLGLRTNNINFGKNQISFNSNLFFRNVQNLIQRSSQVVGGIDTFTFENFGKVLSKGIDVSINYSYNNRWNYEFTSSYNDTRYRSKKDINGRENMYYNSRMKNEPFFRFNSSLGYRLETLGAIPGQLQFIWNARYVHWYYRHFENIGKDNKDIIPTQFVNDFGIIYSFQNSRNTLALDIKNIANSQVYDNFAIQLPGRSINLKLNLNIF